MTPRLPDSERFFHYVLLPAFLAFFGTIGYLIAAYGGVLKVYFILLGVALGAAVVWARLAAQERNEQIHRLELRLRLRELTGSPPDTRLDQLSAEQVAQLRACPNEELPDRARRLLEAHGRAA
ncbi:MAG: DUF6526 family protein [Catalinimonas sp.]